MNIQLSSRTVLISGAGGFLGRELLRALSRHKNVRIIAITSNPGKIIEWFPFMENLECFSTKDWENGKASFDKVDILIHCAFARENNTRLLAESLKFTRDLFEDAAEKGVAGIINISSQSVYGRNKNVPWVEGSNPDVDSEYALAKFSSELLTQATSKSQGIYSTNLRLSSLIGPGLDIRFMSKFVKNALDSEPIRILGGNQVFSFMDVRDAADGISSLLAIEPYQWKSIYNLGTHWRYTIVEIADMVKSIAKEYTSNPVIIKIEQGGDGRNSGMDCSLFFEQTDWNPKYNLETMVRTLFGYYSRIVDQEELYVKGNRK